MERNIDDLSEFIGPLRTTPTMRVEVIDMTGKVKRLFLAPPGFQLERYVDALYPENDFMMYATHEEVNISVLENDRITEIYRGKYK
jgi:hypothetical protein